jgi:hypothetical protein
MKAVLAIVGFLVVGFFLLTSQEGDALPDNIRYQAVTFKKFEADHPQTATFKIYKYRVGKQLIVMYELDDDSALGLRNYLNKARMNFSNQGFELMEYDQNSDFSGSKGQQSFFHSVFEYKGLPYPVLLMQPDQDEATTILQGLRSIELLNSDE